MSGDCKIEIWVGAYSPRDTRDKGFYTDFAAALEELGWQKKLVYLDSKIGDIRFHGFIEESKLEAVKQAILTHQSKVKRLAHAAYRKESDTHFTDMFPKDSPPAL